MATSRLCAQLNEVCVPLATAPYNAYCTVYPRPALIVIGVCLFSFTASDSDQNVLELGLDRYTCICPRH